MVDEKPISDCTKCPAEEFCTVSGQTYRMDYCVFDGVVKPYISESD